MSFELDTSPIVRVSVRLLV